ncbi:MAG: transposase [Ignavibacteria bacterium]|nr:transposase [Ignavibacteria bacterium]MDP3580707.1 transposase [Ignavibacteria bacterium]
MVEFKETYRVDSARLQEWDYSTPWWYYVTINTKDHIEYFGNAETGKIQRNELGLVVEECWKEIPKHFLNVELDYYVIMPNHVHGILILTDKRKDVACNVSTNKMSVISPKPNSLSAVVRSFKSAVTKTIRENGYNNFAWQPRFYDRIIRSEKELFNIRKYIDQNPLKWEFEKNKSENIFEL